MKNLCTICIRKGSKGVSNKNFRKLFKNNSSVAENLNINLNKRPEELSNEMFYRIAEQYEKLFD